MSHYFTPNNQTYAYMCLDCVNHILVVESCWEQWDLLDSLMFLELCLSQGKLSFISSFSILILILSDYSVPCGQVNSANWPIPRVSYHQHQLAVSIPPLYMTSQWFGRACLRYAEEPHHYVTGSLTTSPCNVVFLLQWCARSASLLCY